MRKYEKWFIIAYRWMLIVGLLALATSLNNQFTVLNGKLENLEKNIQELNHKVDSLASEVDTLKSIHPWKEVKSKKLSSKICKEGTFFGFILYTPVDTTVCNSFKVALAAYTGPSVKVNSLKRYGTKSRHCVGRAIDLELTQELVFYLTSDAGKQWLIEHQLTFMIEGKPGSSRVKKYVPFYKDYVFFNPKATGDHVHIQKV